MDKFTVRHINLIRLRDEKCGQSNIVLAKAIGRSPAYVARLLVDTNKPSNKPISEKTADIITDSFGLPRGWLDVEPDSQHSQSTKILIVSAIYGISDNGEHCEFVELSKPIEVPIPATTFALKAYKIMTDRYDPRVKYGEFILVTQLETLIPGTDVLVRQSDKEFAGNKCKLAKIDSIRDENIKTSPIVGSGSPTTYKLEEHKGFLNQIVSIIDPILINK